MTRVRHADPADGLIQASSVMPLVRSRELLSATVIQSLVPLKDTPPPNKPLTQRGPLSVPVLPLPEASAAVVPAPSLKLQAPTSPVVLVAWGVTVTATEP